MPAEVPFSLRPLQPPDASPVQELWTTRFGGDPPTQEKWIEAALSPSHTAVGIVARSTSEGNVVGVSFLDVGGRTYTQNYLGLDTLDLTVPLTDRNGIFHLSCVRSNWESQGIGSAFYERRLTVLAERDVPHAFGVAWHRAAPVDSRQLFDKYNFTRLTTVEHFYSRTGTRPHCPDCTGPCTCIASLYGRSVAVPSPHASPEQGDGRTP